jgi:HD superfamily phosphohydrolase
LQINKNKIINDPVYGFITIPNELIFDIIEHPYFQRLRRIKQLGLTNLVYPGALHTRFHHAIGAMHLMQQALDNLRIKGIEISNKEYEACLIAILLHDIGHGPFSHTLEFNLLNSITHEDISLSMFHKLNTKFNGALKLAIEIFSGSYTRTFFHQLVSSQLDIDRLDYLKRDSYFTGVSEGQIGAGRIIKMLNVHEERIVVEEKGIYSIENFLSARRLMYWQVYLHKTSVSAEEMLIQLINRARFLTQSGVKVEATPALAFFLERDITKKSILEDDDIIDLFALLDDNDIWGSMKYWREHDDIVLSLLSNMLLARNILTINLGSTTVSDVSYNKVLAATSEFLKIPLEEAIYFTGKGQISNSAYISKDQNINILKKTGQVEDIAKASDLPNIKAMRTEVTKHFLCWHRGLGSDVNFL